MDGMDLANGWLLCFHLPGAGRHVGLGTVLAGGESTARHSRLGHHPRRPALHFTARWRLHPAGLARNHRNSALGGTYYRDRFFGGGVPLGLTEILTRTNLLKVGGQDPQISPISTEGDGSIASPVSHRRLARKKAEDGVRTPASLIAYRICGNLRNLWTKGGAIFVRWFDENFN
jgi:hypothetical protein